MFDRQSGESFCLEKNNPECHTETHKMWFIMKSSEKSCSEEKEVNQPTMHNQWCMNPECVGKCHYHPCKSHNHGHQWADFIMTWLSQDKRKCEHKVVRLVWDHEYLHFAQCISISPHGIDCKQTWCRRIYRMNKASWLNPLIIIYLNIEVLSIDWFPSIYIALHVIMFVYINKYCSLVWYHCGMGNSIKLERIQERALRVVYNDTS